jgi:hypothetical protein
MVYYPSVLTEQRKAVFRNSLVGRRSTKMVYGKYRRLNGDEVAIMRYEKPTLLRMKVYSTTRKNRMVSDEIFL